MVDFVINLVATHGYIAIFFFLMIGILGIPMPDEVLMSYVGVLISTGKLHPLAAFIAAWFGSSCGVTVSYFVGRTLGHAILVKFHGSPEKAERIRQWFDRKGRWALVFGYFMPGLRHGTPIVAGSTGLQYTHFALSAYAGGFLWTCTYLSLGYFLGRRWLQASEHVHFILLGATGVLVAAVILFFGIKWCRARRRRRNPTP